MTLAGWYNESGIYFSGNFPFDYCKYTGSNMNRFNVILHLF